MKIDVNPKALGILPISDDPGPKNGQTALDSEKAKADRKSTRLNSSH